MIDPIETNGVCLSVHDERRVPFREASRSEFFLDVHQHIEEHVGFAPEVFHDLVSDLIHVDFYPVPPAAGRRWWTLVTNGMSGAPMRVRCSGERERLGHAELCLLLPPDWPMLDPRARTAHWPLTMLAEIARMPHVFDTWIEPGHIVINGEPPEPYSPDTMFTGALVTRPTLLAPGFSRLRVRKEVTIDFLAVIPLLPEEFSTVGRIGTGAFTDLLAKSGVTELLDPGRSCVAGLQGCDAMNPPAPGALG